MAGQLVLGTVTLLSGAFSGFDQAQSKARVRLLSDGTSVRNEVIQQGSQLHREATVTFVAETADANTVRGYYEDVDQVSFIDYEDEIRTVLVYDFSKAVIVDGLWSCTATLLALTDPEPEGS